MSWILVALCLLPILAALYTVATYNRLVHYRVESENSWSQIDVQLKRRHELIPRLVEAAKGAMDYERQTLGRLAQARERAMAAGGVADRLEAEGEISGLLSHLVGAWEEYPALKMSKNALELQKALRATESRIAYTRGHYNDIVANHNALIEQFPSSLIARVAGFEGREFFKAPPAARPALDVPVGASRS